MRPYLYFVLLLMISSSANINAQQLFQSVPLDFGDSADLSPSVMYYDSIEEVSYISGKFNIVNDTSCNVIKYDGSIFLLMPKSPIINATNAIVRYKDKIYIGGEGLVTWDGTNWTVVDSNVSIENLVVHENKLYAMGTFDSIAGHDIGMVAVWNDTTWSDLHRIDTLLLPPNGNRGIFTLAFYNDNIYVAGKIYHPQYPGREDLMMFNGQTWTNVDGFHIDGIGSIKDLLVWEDDLFVSGGFVEQTGSPGNAIAKWDGTNWHNLGEGLMRIYPQLADIVNFKSELYMCGWFNYMNDINLGADYQGFVKWNGTQWCSMGFHADNVPIGLGTWKDQLFIMGAFKVVNGDSMQYMAKWVGGNYTDICSTPTTSIENKNLDLKFTVSPNPTTEEFNIRFNNDRTQSTYAVRITNILGKIIYSTNHTANMGMNQFNIDLSGTASGIYFLNIKGENINKSIKLIKK